MQTTFRTIPIAGSIKHGAKQGKEGKERPVELGYFVAQVHSKADSKRIQALHRKRDDKRTLRDLR